MPPPSNPTELARETFKLLATRRIAPTPENYQRIYHELSGEPPQNAGKEFEENLGKVLDGLGRKTPHLAPKLTPLAKSLETRDWEAFEQALESLGNTAPQTQENWAELVRDLIKQWDLKQAGLTSPRKKEALERVLINFGRNSVELHAKLSALTKAWMEGAAGPSDIEVVESAPLDTAPAPGTDTAVEADRRGMPVNVASPDEIPGMLAELLAQALLQGVMPHVSHLPALADEAARLARQARNARLPDAFAALSKSLRQFWIQVELQTDADGEILDGLMRLLKLVIDNITELLLDDQWLRGQLAVVQDIISKPLDHRVIADAEARFKEVIFKQGTVKHSLNEAKATLKNLVTAFIERIGVLSENTGSYNKKLEGYTQMLGSTEDIPALNDILQNILADTKSLHLDMIRSHDELESARRQAESAEQRIKYLEAELGQISELVYQDHLTGTLNRRGMEDAFEREFARSERHGIPLSIALLDVDHFKRLNDTYGHDTGDQALIHLANVVKEILRPTDTVARYGGEEFVVILPNTADADAVSIMTRLQRELTKRFFLHDNERILITFSAGVTQREGQETSDAMIARADGALYRAKQTGRNRVLLANPGESGPPAGKAAP